MMGYLLLTPYLPDLDDLALNLKSIVKGDINLPQDEDLCVALGRRNGYSEVLLLLF